MPLWLNAADYVVIILMLLCSAGVGLYIRLTGGRQNSTIQFLKAGKNMSILPVSFSLMATTFSSASILGIPAEVYSYGMHMAMAWLAYCVGGYIAVYSILPVFFDMNLSTSYEYLERRFGKVTRYVISLVFCINMIQFSTVVLYAPSLVLNALTGISFWTSILSMAGVCAFYSTLGGLRAILWADLFQSLLMFSTLFLIIIKVPMDAGGLSNVYEIAKQNGRLQIINVTGSFTERYTIWNCLTFGLVTGMFSHGTSYHQVQRLMSVRSLKRAKMSFAVSVPVNILFTTFCCLSGVVIYSYFYNCDPLQVANSQLTSRDQLVPYILLKLYAHLPGLTGLGIAGIFSSSLSTMSSAINALVAATLEDLLRPCLRRRNLKESTMAYLAKILGFVYIGISILLIILLVKHKGIMEMAVIMYSFLGAPTLGTFLLGMFTSSANEMGTLIGLFSGFSMNAWIAFGSLHNKAKYPTLPLSAKYCVLENISSYFVANSTENPLFGSEISNSTLGFGESNEEARYIFPLYRISYMWYGGISCFTVIFVGYISSLVINLWKEQQKVDSQTFSPVIRKWLSGTRHSENIYIEIPLNANKNEFENAPDDALQ